MKQKKKIPTTPRSLDEIQREFQQESFKAGSVQYQVRIMQRELEYINERIEALNKEATAAKQLEEQAKQLDSEPKQVEAPKAASNG